ncbi:unnamed protein product [Vitrella brassicaformis CCMP3155]|uniref:DUF429 domain-containing protein n=1 Tax=Vitrella brassicaformis (strain CCMP3155) TaxID=1169540 RepID=A0A0G4H5S7_VITBC|nr:unnamed protein product [Vitrella brassicaformis CCMP3155]|eukprot:CEM39029.1 unnamed protein product [Vitrella brassicaformis CCMP3155]
MTQEVVIGIDWSGAKEAGRAVWVSRGCLSSDAAGQPPVFRLTECFPASNLPDAGPSRDESYKALLAYIRAHKGTVGYIGLDAPVSLSELLLDRLELQEHIKLAGDTATSSSKAHTPAGDQSGATRWGRFIEAFGEAFDSPEAFKRACDACGSEKELKRASDVLHKTPWLPHNVRMFRQAYHSLASLIAPLVRSDDIRVAPMQSAAEGVPLLLETCPASLLKAIDSNNRDDGQRPAKRQKTATDGSSGKATLPPALYQPYKGTTDAHRRQRERIWASFEDGSCELVRLQTADDGQLRALCVGNAGGDALDSVLAALCVCVSLPMCGNELFPWPRTGRDDVYLTEGCVYC